MQLYLCGWLLFCFETGFSILLVGVLQLLSFFCLSLPSSWDFRSKPWIWLTERAISVQPYVEFSSYIRLIFFCESYDVLFTYSFLANTKVVFSLRYFELPKYDCRCTNTTLRLSFSFNNIPRNWIVLALCLFVLVILVVRQDLIRWLWLPWNCVDQMSQNS